MTSTSRPCSFRRSSEKLARTCNSQRKLASNETGTSESKGIITVSTCIKTRGSASSCIDDSTTTRICEMLPYVLSEVKRREGRRGARERSESESEKVSVMKSLRLKSILPDEEQGSLWKDSASLKPRRRPTVPLNIVQRYVTG